MSVPPARDAGDEWLTTEQLCAWLTVEKEWVWDQCQRRRIPHISLGRMKRFNRAEVLGWLEEQRVR